jgi:hypothetical protein
MGLRFVVQKGAADPGHDLAFLMLEWAHPAALRTGLFLAEVLGRLLLRGHFEGASEQRLHRGHGDLFHLREGHVGSGTLLAPVLPHDDFSPAVSQFLDAAKILGCEFGCRHDASLQWVP